MCPSWITIYNDFFAHNHLQRSVLYFSIIFIYNIVYVYLIKKKPNFYNGFTMKMGDYYICNFFCLKYPNFHFLLYYVCVDKENKRSQCCFIWLKLFRELIPSSFFLYLRTNLPHKCKYNYIASCRFEGGIRFPC